MKYRTIYLVVIYDRNGDGATLLACEDQAIAEELAGRVAAVVESVLLLEAVSD